MIDQKSKRAILKRILDSDSFAHSQTHKDLLEYLVNASLEDIPPKEYEIATQVLHKGTDFDPSQNTIVRVNMYNLRKKLEHYYAHEGSAETYRIEIPRGHYTIKFVPNNLTPIFKKISVWPIITIVLLILNISYLFIFRMHSLHDEDAIFLKNSFVWNDFFENKLPKQVVLGDHFFFIQNSNDRQKRTIMRRDDINSWQEFSNYRKIDDEHAVLTKLRYPMFPRNSVWPSIEIIKLFVKTGQDFHLEYSSNVAASNFQENDIIFIGSFHTLEAFKQTFNHSIFTFQLYPNQLSYFNEDTDSLITHYEQGDPFVEHQDYCILRKVPGPANNTIFIFSSFHETGISSGVKFFTTPASVKELQEAFITKYGYLPQYFEVLFKASGYNRTAYKTEIEYVHKVEPTAKFW